MLTLTKSLNYLNGYYADMAQGLVEHGHELTKYMYTDNAQGEFGLVMMC